MKYIFFLAILCLGITRPLSADELLKNGDFETGDVSGWHYWETYPWDGDGAPVESPTHVTITVPGVTGAPTSSSTSGFFALTQQITHGTARGGLYQEIKVVANTPYVLTGQMAFSGDDAGDVTLIGILDGAWNPTFAFTTLNRNYAGGNTVSPWTGISLTIIPTKGVITVFTETRQDWPHGNATGWYDSLSLHPVQSTKNNPPPQSAKTNSLGRK